MGQDLESESGAEEDPMPDIEDTDKLRGWMSSHIKRPPKGYDDMHRPDGTPLTDREQIDTYIQQTMDIIDMNKQRGRSRDAYEPFIKSSILAMIEPDETTSTDTEPS